MISDELRKKLEELNRGPLTLKKGTVPSTASRGQSPFSPVPLEEAVKGRVIGEPDRPCLVVERALAEIFAPEQAARLSREFESIWSMGRFIINENDLDRDWPAVVASPPGRMLFLDIETCGLASTPLFLIGTMHFDADNTFHLRQFFARNYAEERHVLAHVAEHLQSFDRLVTFNGKSFDWPYIRDRALFHAVRLGPEPAHLDLLHEARRRWRGVLPNCQLQTLEFHISRRRRTGDIPGHMIPEAYHRFVRTGHAAQMADVVHHNALDLITMAELVLFILQGGELSWE